MNRDFAYNLLLLLGINAVIKPFYIFGIERTVQNTVGAEAWGSYYTIFTFAFLFQVINDLGLQNFNNRHISQNQQELSTYFGRIIPLKIILSGLYFSLMFSIAIFDGRFYENWPIIFWVGFNMVLLSFILYLRSNLSGVGLYTTDSILSSLDKALLSILVGGLLLGHIWSYWNFEVIWFVYAQTISLLLTSIAAIFVQRNYLRVVTLSFNLTDALHILKSSLPFALIILLMTLYTRIDILMIDALLHNGAYQVGAYSAAYRILDVLNMLGYLVAGLLLPMFSKMLGINKNIKGIKELIRLAWPFMWALSVSIAIGLYFYRLEIMHLLYDEATPYWGEILGWLGFAFIVISGGYVIGTLLTANGQLKHFNLLLAMSIGVNIGLNYWLIPWFGAVGAAIATVITQTVSLSLQLLLIWKLLKIKLDTKIWIQMTIYFFGMCLLTSICYNLSWDWRWTLLLAWSSSVFWAILLGLINIASWRNALKKR